MKLIIIDKSSFIYYNTMPCLKIYSLCQKENLQFYYCLHLYTSLRNTDCNIFAQVSESISIYGNKIHLTVVSVCCAICKRHNIIHRLSVMMYIISKVIGILYIFFSLLFIQILDVTSNHYSPRDRFIAKPITTTTLIHAYTIHVL